MREIKFRAFGYLFDGKKSMFTPSMGEFNDINCEIDNFISDGNILMQYAGLKDKNSVEIYEGDIVRGSAYQKEIYTGTVEFYDASFVMKINSSEGYYRLNKMTFQELEVIGNIYENEEFLKQ